MAKFEVTWIETRRGRVFIEADSEDEAVEELAMMLEDDFNKTVEREDFDAHAKRI